MSVSIAESLPSSPAAAAAAVAKGGGAAYKAPRGPSTELFDPQKHLAYEPPSEKFSFEDLGFSNDLGIGSVALTLPFKLVRSPIAAAACPTLIRILVESAVQSRCYQRASTRCSV